MRPLHAAFIATLMLSASPALAGTADDFVSALQAFAEKNDASVTVETTSESGEGFTLDNMTVTAEGVNAKVAQTDVAGYVNAPDGGSAEMVTSQGIAISAADNQLAITIDELKTTGLNFPGNALSTPAMFSLYAAQTMTNMVAKWDGLTIVEVPASQVSTDQGADGVYTSTTTIDGIVIDLANLPSGGSSGTIGELGYEQLNASVNGTATYDPAAGIIQSDDTLIAVENAASIGMSYRLEGYTEQFARQMSQWSETYGERSNSPEAMQALMPMLSSVKVASMTLQITDASLTGKLLDMQAKKMGTSGEQLAQSAPMFLGMGLSRLQMPELTQMVTRGGRQLPAEPRRADDFRRSGRTGFDRRHRRFVAKRSESVAGTR